MKNTFTNSIWKDSKNGILLMITLFVAFNSFAFEGGNKTDGTNKKPLPPPTPTVVLTLPAGANCFSSLTASGCDVGNTVYWYRDVSYFYATGATITVNNVNPVFLTAKCFDGSAFGPASLEYKATSATYTEITPTTASICSPGGSATLNASSATSGITNQWRLNSSNISGANSPTYSATTVGSYSVVATKGACSFTSGSSVVTSVTAPTINITSTVSSPATITNGQSLVLTSNGCISSGGTVAWSTGATTSTITVTPSSNTNYTFVCTKTPCVLTSSAFVVNVLPTITVTSPTPTAICSNIGTTIPVTFTTTGTLTGSYTVTLYQTIQFSGSHTSTYTIATATTATNSANITLPSNQEGNGNNGFGNIYSYYIQVTNGATVSNNYNINLSQRPNVTVSFTGSCGSQTATLATQTFYVAGTLQWKKNGVNVGAPITFFPPSGPSATYSTADNGTYTIDYTDDICTTTSIPVIFNQNIVPTIALTQSTSPSCTSTLTATGCLGIVKWYRRLSDGNWNYFTNNSPLIFTTSATPSDFRATCTLNSCESTESNVVVVLPNFTEIIPQNPSICSVGGSILLNASSANLGLTYQWKLNGTNISGATSPSYTATTGGNYSVFTGLGACNYTSSQVFVNTVSPPTVSITSTQTNPATITNGQSLVLTSNGCISNGGTVLWSNGATTSTITVTPSSNTSYTFTCTKPPCIVTSSAFVVNVNPLLPPTITSSSPTTCTGTSVTLTAAGCAGTVTWSTLQTGASISVSPSITTSYTATCTLGSVVSANSLALSIGVFDGVITSLASGNWNTPTTWSCNCVPAACNDVIVDTGHVVVIPATEKGRLKNLTLRGTVDVKTTGTMALK